MAHLDQIPGIADLFLHFDDDFLFPHPVRCTHGRPTILTARDPPLLAAAHHPPLTTHHSPLTTYHSPKVRVEDFLRDGVALYQSGQSGRVGQQPKHRARRLRQLSVETVDSMEKVETVEAHGRGQEGRSHGQGQAQGQGHSRRLEAAKVAARGQSKERTRELIFGLYPKYEKKYSVYGHRPTLFEKVLISREGGTYHTYHAYLPITITGPTDELACHPNRKILQFYRNQHTVLFDPAPPSNAHRSPPTTHRLPPAARRPPPAARRPPPAARPGCHAGGQAVCFA